MKPPPDGSGAFVRILLTRLPIVIVATLSALLLSTEFASAQRFDTVVDGGGAAIVSAATWDAGTKADAIPPATGHGDDEDGADEGAPGGGNGSDPPGNSGNNGNAAGSGIGSDPPGNSGNNGNADGNGISSDPPGNSGNNGNAGGNGIGSDPPGNSGNNGNAAGNSIGSDPPGNNGNNGNAGGNGIGAGRDVAASGILPQITSGSRPHVAGEAPRSTVTPETTGSSAIENVNQLVETVAVMFPRPAEPEAPAVFRAVSAAVPDDVPVLPISVFASALLIVGSLSLSELPLGLQELVRAWLAYVVH